MWTGTFNILSICTDFKDSYESTSITNVSNLFTEFKFTVMNCIESVLSMRSVYCHVLNL